MSETRGAQHLSQTQRAGSLRPGAHGLGHAWGSPDTTSMEVLQRRGIENDPIRRQRRRCPSIPSPAPSPRLLNTRLSGQYPAARSSSAPLHFQLRSSTAALSFRLSFLHSPDNRMVVMSAILLRWVTHIRRNLVTSCVRVQAP